MGSVYKRGGVWWCKYRDESGRIRRIALRSAHGKMEAQRLVDDLERAAERRRLGLEDAAPTPMTVEELWREYDAAVTAKQQSANSTRGRFKLHILPALGPREISRVTPADVEKLLTAKQEKGLSPRSCEYIRTHLVALFNFGIHKAKRMRGPNPAQTAARVKVPKRRVKYLTVPQLQALQQASGAYWPIFKFAALTGLRKGELCGLRWDDVDLEHGAITVSRSYDLATTKGGKTRVVAIHRDLLADLQSARKTARGPLVFPDDNGRMRTKDWDVAAIFKTALAEAGLIQGFEMVCRRSGCGHRSELKPTKTSYPCPRCKFLLWPVAVPLALQFRHLRSTWGTLAYRATGDIRFVQEGLGHADVATTTAHYADLLTDHIREQAAKFPSLGTGLGTTDETNEAPKKTGGENAE